MMCALMPLRPKELTPASGRSCGHGLDAVLTSTGSVLHVGRHDALTPIRRETRSEQPTRAPKRCSSSEPESPEVPLAGSPSAFALPAPARAEVWVLGELVAGPVVPVSPEGPLRAFEPVPAPAFAPPVEPLLEAPDVAPLLPEVPVEAVGAAPLAA